MNTINKNTTLFGEGIERILVVTTSDGGVNISYQTKEKVVQIMDGKILDSSNQK